MLLSVSLGVFNKRTEAEVLFDSQTGPEATRLRNKILGADKQHDSSYFERPAKHSLTAESAKACVCGGVERMAQ